MSLSNDPEHPAVVAQPGRSMACRHSYALACVCLIVTAALLRFYGLSDHSLWYDEIQAANNSAYDWSDILTETRRNNSSPIIYPILLWIVQKIHVSAFSLRIVPAVASVLTVVALLLLPRVGVNRTVAFFSALLATVSIPAIKHAQDVREYSVDALVATLMIAGLLAFLKDGRKALLSASLIIAPLIQYGLVLLGVTVIATAAAMQAIVLLQEGALRAGWKLVIFRICTRLSLPALGFFLSCVASYAITFHHQWHVEEFSRMIESSYYYGLNTYSETNGGVLSILEFVMFRTALFMQFHLPEIVAILTVVLLAGAALLYAARERIHWTPIPTLFAFSVTGALLGALFELYPFGSIRQTMYLSPVVFLTVGHSLHSILNILPSSTRTGCAILLAGFIAWAGANDILASGHLHRSGAQRDQDRYFNRMLDVLEHTPERDAIWLAGNYRTQQFFSFYYRIRYSVSDKEVYDSEDKRPQSGRFRFRGGICDLPVVTIEECLRDYSQDFFPGTSHPLHRSIDRLWIITDIPRTPWRRREFLAAFGRGDSVQRQNPRTSRNENRESSVDVSLIYSHGESAASSILTPYKIASLFKVENFKRFYEPALNRLLRVGEADRILIRSLFDVYVRDERQLIYVKEPCDAGDTWQHFNLFIYPSRLEDIDAGRQSKGFDSYYFRFGRHGVRYQGRCVAMIDLPEYDIERISTGQYFRRGDISERETVRVWSDDAIFPGAPAGARPDGG